MAVVICVVCMHIYYNIHIYIYIYIYMYISESFDCMNQNACGDMLNAYALLFYMHVHRYTYILCIYSRIHICEIYVFWPRWPQDSSVHLCISQI